MKIHKLFICLLIAFSFLMITACGGGGGDSTGSGEVTMSITDAKPLLPEGAENITNLWVKFTDVLVHKSGGGWNSLPLNGYPYTVDLLQLVNGVTMEIVPPVKLEYGKYTQIRLVIDSAWIWFDDDPKTEVPLEIPSGNLKTDKNFTFDPQYPADIIIDFDLSQSLVVTGPSGTPSYKLKPVLHIVKASEAATIYGKIAQESFIPDKNAIVTVFYNNSGPKSPGDNYEEYTKVEVSESGIDPTEFSIFWLVPNKDTDPPRGDYKVEIDFDSDGTVDFEESGIYLGIGDTFDLNGGDPIS